MLEACRSGLLYGADLGWDTFWRRAGQGCYAVPTFLSGNVLEVPFEFCATSSSWSVWWGPAFQGCFVALDLHSWVPTASWQACIDGTGDAPCITGGGGGGTLDTHHTHLGTSTPAWPAGTQ
eukprot:1143893-Pelagomonas_calceolata.AAC.13